MRKVKEGAYSDKDLARAVNFFLMDKLKKEVESRALKAYDHSDWVNAPSARSWQLYHVFHGQIDFGGAETAYYSSQTM